VEVEVLRRVPGNDTLCAWLRCFKRRFQIGFDPTDGYVSPPTSFEVSSLCGMRQQFTRVPQNVLSTEFEDFHLPETGQGQPAVCRLWSSIESRFST
jgi:hypothetical protein